MRAQSQFYKIVDESTISINEIVYIQTILIQGSQTLPFLNDCNFLNNLNKIVLFFYNLKDRGFEVLLTPRMIVNFGTISIIILVQCFIRLFINIQSQAA